MSIDFLQMKLNKEMNVPFALILTFIKLCNVTVIRIFGDQIFHRQLYHIRYHEGRNFHINKMNENILIMSMSIGDEQVPAAGVKHHLHWQGHHN